ncbi:hypothetical protein [Streptomyces sp. NPDC047990]|uniref:hypothetical protein n=1 Tax=Streptomyces sp. NPDC047990 TaxID=3365496 RepID=UPI003711CC6F
MAGKVWQAHEGGKFLRDLKLGTAYYYENDWRLVPWEQYSYSVVVFTETHWFPITGRQPTTKHGDPAKSLLHSHGPFFENVEDLPHWSRRMRNAADTWQALVPGPLGDSYEAPLDRPELRGLDKRVRDSSNPRTRRRMGTWGV